MKNDTTFVRMAIVITLETQNVEKIHLTCTSFFEFPFVTNRNRRNRFSQNKRRRAHLKNAASKNLIFAWGLSYDLSKFGDEFTSFFRL